MPPQPPKLTTWADRLRMIGILLRTEQNPAYLLRWFRNRKRSPLEVRLPWISFRAIAALRQLPLRSARVFEYGSGGSTLFWLDSGASCFSVEHDRAWYAVLQPVVAAAADRCDYRWVPAEPCRSSVAAPADPADPESYASSDPKHVNASFHRYVTQIDEFPDDHFDVILIDGRARPSCIRHAVPKLKRGGTLILDNSERPHYLALTASILSGWRRRDFRGVGPMGVASVDGRTSFFTKGLKN